MLCPTVGIPHSARASPRLFTAKILLSGGTTSYCTLSQKVLKGAAARMLIYWLCSVLAQTDDGSLYSKLLGFTNRKPPMQRFCIFLGGSALLIQSAAHRCLHCLAEHSRRRLSTCLALAAMYTTFAEHGRLNLQVFCFTTFCLFYHYAV